MTKQRDPNWRMRILEEADRQARQTPDWMLSVELREEFRRLDAREAALAAKQTQSDKDSPG